MLKATAQFFDRVMHRFLPDAFIFALLLTFVVFGLGVLIEGQSPLKMVEFWGNGFFNLLKFSMEMALILITGFTLAKTNAVSKILGQLASLPKTHTQGILMATLISSIACFINWGFGLIVAGLFSLELAKNLKKVNYGLLIAASYSGFLVWHGGLSGSIPLKLTAANGKFLSLHGNTPIDLTQTIFSSFNFLILFANLAVILLLNYFLSKDSENIKTYDLPKEEKFKAGEKVDSFASWCENSKIITILISLMGATYLGIKFADGAKLNLNLTIFIFLLLGIFLHQTPKKFLFHFTSSVKDSGGIILQFPIYAGIMGMMSASGLAQSMSEFFVAVSGPKTFLLFTYLSAGIVNFFVPSGGGQWAIQAPIILPAATEVGADLAKASMAIAWGDAWTNMVQPFWALPLLAVARLNLRDMMTYSVLIFIASGVISSLIFVIL